MSYLKSKTVHIESLGEEIEIRQLHAKAQSEVSAQYNKGSEESQFLAGIIAVKYGVPAWSERTTDDIAMSMTMSQIIEINDAVAALSAADEKNSASTQSEPSSSS